MEIDFNRWNNIKKGINKKKDVFYVKKREIWSVNM